MTEHSRENALPSPDYVAGLIQSDEPCWYAATLDGMAFEWGDGTPHWQSEDEGSERIAAILKTWDDAPEERPILTLRRESEGCWHLTCAECGYRYDEDEWVSHFPDRREAEHAADDCDWHIVGGRALCPECYLDLRWRTRVLPPAENDAEALEACREQRADLLELLQVEREQHAEALVRAWHEGYGAGSSDATDGWLKPGSPRTACPYVRSPGGSDV